MPHDPAAITLVFALFGLATGSFINVLACRVPEGMSIGGRSRCPGCRHQLSAWELVPVFSFILLRGHCRSCGMRIAWQYPIVEILGAVLAALAARMHGADFAPAITLALALQALLLIAATDARTQKIPDLFTLVFVVLAAAYAYMLPAWSPWGIVLGAGFFAAQWVLSRGKWVGSGDIFLGGGIGILLGDLAHTGVALGAAYIIGAAVAAILLLTKQKRRTETISFGPFLALGTCIALFVGERILEFFPLM